MLNDTKILHSVYIYIYDRKTARKEKKRKSSFHIIIISGALHREKPIICPSGSDIWTAGAEEDGRIPPRNTTTNSALFYFNLIFFFNAFTTQGQPGGDWDSLTLFSATLFGWITEPLLLLHYRRKDIRHCRRKTVRRGRKNKSLRKKANFLLLLNACAKCAGGGTRLDSDSSWQLVIGFFFGLLEWKVWMAKEFMLEFLIGIYSISSWYYLLKL